MPGEATAAVRNLLKGLLDAGGDRQRVGATAAAERLGLGSGYLAARMKQLGEAGWVDYEPGQGARLTEKGLAEARRLVRKLRLLAGFLERALGFDPEAARAEAKALAHATSPRLEQALADYLGESAEQEHLAGR